MYLANILDNIRLELQDTAQVLYEDDELIRAVTKCIALMSRLLPKRSIIETQFKKDITETLVIAGSTGTLAKKPIKVNSEIITGKTRDTDYSINYITGVVTGIGSNLPEGNHSVTYTLNSSMLDVSAVLSDRIRIERVEYPAEGQKYITFEEAGNILIFKSDVSFTDKGHIRIIYLAKWIPPSTEAEGDYPSHLDNAVIIGSVGQALIFKAEKYVQDASTLFNASSTTLTSMDTPLAAAVTALNNARDAFIASLNTLVGLTSSQGNAVTALGKVSKELVGAASPAYDGAKTHLTTGKALINAVTAGADVGQVYANYADMQVRIAAGYIAEAGQNIALAESFISKSTREGVAGNGYANEATQRIALTGQYLNKSDRQQAIAAQYLNVAGRMLASGQAKINEFLSMLGIKPEFQFYKSEPSQPSY